MLIGSILYDGMDHYQYCLHGKEKGLKEKTCQANNKTTIIVIKGLIASGVFIAQWAIKKYKVYAGPSLFEQAKQKQQQIKNKKKMIAKQA